MPNCFGWSSGAPKGFENPGLSWVPVFLQIFYGTFDSPKCCHDDFGKKRPSRGGSRVVFRSSPLAVCILLGSVALMVISTFHGSPGTWETGIHPPIRLAQFTLTLSASQAYVIQTWLMSSTQTDKNNPCCRWTKRHSQLRTFSHPTSSRTSSNCLCHRRLASGWPYRFHSRSTTGSMLLHDCIHMSGQSDFGILSYRGASSIFTRVSAVIGSAAHPSVW